MVDIVVFVCFLPLCYQLSLENELKSRLVMRRSLPAWFDSVVLCASLLRCPFLNEVLYSTYLGVCRPFLCSDFVVPDFVHKPFQVLLSIRLRWGLIDAHTLTGLESSSLRSLDQFDHHLNIQKGLLWKMLSIFKLTFSHNLREPTPHSTA